MMPHCLCEDDSISANAFRVYGGILRHSKGEATVQVSREKLMASAAIGSAPTLWRALSELAAAGVIGLKGGVKKHGRLSIDLIPVGPSVSDLKHSAEPECFKTEILPDASVSDLKHQYFNPETLSVSDLKHSEVSILLVNKFEELDKGVCVGAQDEVEVPDLTRSVIEASVHQITGDQFPYSEHFMLETANWYRSGATPADVLSALKVAERQDPPVQPRSLTPFVASCLIRIKARRLQLEAVTPESVGTGKPGPTTPARTTKSERDAEQARLRRQAASRLDLDKLYPEG